MKNRQATLFLAVTLVAPVFALADNIPGHSRNGNTYVAFSEGFSEQQGPQSGSARCNFLLISIKKNAVETNSFARASFSEFAKSDKSANFVAPVNTTVESDSDNLKLVNLGGNQGASSDKDHGTAAGSHSSADGDSNEEGSGGGAPAPDISVAEPASQTLLLIGLAAVGILFYRRKTLTNAI